MRTTKEMHGVRVRGGKKGKRKIGKISKVVFHPTEARAVGYMVRRPDLLWMFKRADKFLALDSYTVVDGRVIAKPDLGAWDKAACKRLGIDLDVCLFWENMPVKTTDGYELGYLGVISFDESNGKVISATVTDGSASTVVLGTYEIPVKLIKGYTKGFVLLDPEARDIDPSGGAAAAAGRGVATATKGVTVAAVKAGIAVDKGAFALGKTIGKVKRSLTPEEEAAETLGIAASSKDASDGQAERAVQESKKASSAPAASTPEKKPISEVAAKSVGKHLGKTKGMFGAFKDEYKKGVSGDD